MIRRDDYFALVKARPDLFRNPDDAAFKILLDEAEIGQAEAYMAGKLTERGAPAEWAQVGVAYQDQYLYLLRDAVRFADGSLGTYIRSVDPEPDGCPGVAMLPVWQGQVLLIRHFRHGTRAWHLEIPRGFGSDSDPEVSARAELTEEIGAAEVTLTNMGELYSDAGSDGAPVILFYAEIGSYGGPELEEGISEIRPTPLADFERMIADGDLHDGYLLAAYARAKARHLI
jgi:ADP-ribose pyrophosphatase